MIQRRQGSQEPNGIIEETAMFPVLSALGKSFGEDPAVKDPHAHDMYPSPGGHPEERMMDLVDKAAQIYASNGYTTVSAFTGSLEKAKLFQTMGEQGRLPLDLVMGILYVGTTAEQVGAVSSDTYKNHFRVIGGKINLDGGSPGRTAYLREPHYKQLPGEKDYRGYSSIAKQDDMNKLVASYYEAGVPIFIHAIGDAALDQCIEAITYAEKLHPGEDRRTQLIHLQQVNEDQFEALEELDVSLTFQVTHNYYFGDFHAEEIFGPERTARLNPAGSALRHGFSVTIHHDGPSTPSTSSWRSGPRWSGKPAAARCWVKVRTSA